MSSDFPINLENDAMSIFEEINQRPTSHMEVQGLPADTAIPSNSVASENNIERRTELSAERIFSYHTSSSPSLHFNVSTADNAILPGGLYKKLAKAMELMLERQLDTEKADKHFLQGLKQLEKNFKEWVKAIKQDNP